MISLDLKSLRTAYADGSLKPTALVDEILPRIEAHADPAVWIHRLPREKLLEYARRLEARESTDLPLYGVPFAIKDNIDLAGVPTTAGCPEFAYTPDSSAAVVQRLLEAGAIPIGKTNLDQFATGLVGVRSPYGTPRNAYRADIIPGGSSSGSAVAVAAGLVSFALGTDTAGSGRVPAALNGVVGLKPTRGAWSTRGVVPACRSLDCVSVFALSCDDSATVGGICEAFDPADPFSRERQDQLMRASPHPLRVGVPAPSQREFFGDDESARKFDEAIARFRELGAAITQIDFSPFADTAALLYQGPWIAERWAALRAFHRDHADAFFPVTRKIIESGSTASAADAFEGMYRLEALKRKAEAEWRKMDVLLLPTLPRPYTLAEVSADPIGTNTRLGTYTNFVNLLDLSALALPAGVRADGVPHGVTIMARAWGESLLVQIGRGVETNRPFAVGEKSSGKPVRLAVVGAHLSGLPLNHQLTDLGARLAWTGKTGPHYRLFALTNTTPPKPGLRRVSANGAAIDVEVWEMSAEAFGLFVANIPAPMCIGTVGLETGESVKSFLCEPIALEGAQDITQHGGWRSYLAARSRTTPGTLRGTVAK